MILPRVVPQQVARTVGARTCSRAGFSTNWWKKFVDGTNPDNPYHRHVAEFFETQKIDRYRLQRPDLEHWRRWYLSEYRYNTPETEPESDRKQKAFELCKEKFAPQVQQLQRKYPLVVEESSAGDGGGAAAEEAAEEEEGEKASC